MGACRSRMVPCRGMCRRMLLHSGNLARKSTVLCQQLHPDSWPREEAQVVGRSACFTLGFTYSQYTNVERHVVAIVGMECGGEVGV